jgi:hypothetical protein
MLEYPLFDGGEDHVPSFNVDEASFCRPPWTSLLQALQALEKGTWSLKFFNL